MKFYAFKMFFSFLVSVQVTCYYNIAPYILNDKHCHMSPKSEVLYLMKLIVDFSAKFNYHYYEVATNYAQTHLFQCNVK